MATVTEIGRKDGTAYGVAFIVCSNNEVARLGLDLDEDDAIAVMREKASMIAAAGYDYDRCSDFKAYNGGPRLGLIDPVYYVADIDEEGEIGEWRATWQQGAGCTEIPSEFTAEIDTFVEAL